MLLIYSFALITSEMKVLNGLINYDYVDDHCSTYQIQLLDWTRNGRIP